MLIRILSKVLEYCNESGFFSYVFVVWHLPHTFFDDKKMSTFYSKLKVNKISKLKLLSFGAFSRYVKLHFPCFNVFLTPFAMKIPMAYEKVGIFPHFTL